MTHTNPLHQPVLCDPTLAALAIQPGGLYIDATFGRGGHSQAILMQLGAHGELWVCDRDPAAIAYAHNWRSDDTRIHICRHTLVDLQTWPQAAGIAGRVAGILMDLGVSSPQLDEAERGFSFQQTGPLDMRMDPTSGESVAQFLATASEKAIADILWQYGEEKRSRAIAKRIVLARAQRPITTTTDLVKIVLEVIPYQRGKHPATRTFQALRMHINQELAEVRQGLAAAIELLAPGGRLAVISFHSLEDRMVKQFMRDQVTPQDTPRKLPIRHTDPSQKTDFRWVVKQQRATETEAADNPRSRSATLRVIERVV